MNWYRVVAPTGQVGWQAKKPADYRSVPYMPVGLDPFDREFGGEDIYWPEGERDVETLARLCVPSFTFGGCGDGLPIDIAPRLSGRHIVILADSDQPGRTHADKKAVVALEAGAASVRVLHFPELAEHEDVSDYIAQGGTAEDLAERTSHAPPWQPAASGNQSTRSERLEIVCMADVTPKAVEWLWENWVAIGKVSVLAGDGGQGKSTILCDLAARTTQGEQWPNGAPSTAPGGVIILAAEDDVEDTLAPRLIAVGADLKRVFNIRSVTSDDNGRRSFNLQADLAALERQIAAHGDIRLVIIDPISSYLGKVDSHKNADVRSVLEPLGEMAARMRVAVICNNHFSKGAGNANSRIIGSVAFVNQARAAFIVTPDAETEGRYLLMPSKMNNAPMKHGLGYRIESCLIPSDGQEVLTSRVAWESTPVTITADEALAAHSDKGEAKSAKAEAIEFLKDALQNGPRAAGEIKTEATAAGITAKPLRSARTVLGVKPTKTGMAGGWLWALPKVPNDAEGAHVSKRASSDPEGTFGRGKL
ncbi:MAG: AAA family ATPase [Xanthobacteraceae bacterium]